MAIGTDREFLSAEEIERIALTMPYSDYVPGECHCINTHLEDDYAIIELVMKSSGGTFRVKQQHTFHYVNCPRLTAGNGDEPSQTERETETVAIRDREIGEFKIEVGACSGNVYVTHLGTQDRVSLVKTAPRSSWYCVTIWQDGEDCGITKTERVNGTENAVAVAKAELSAFAELSRRGLPAISGGASTEAVVAAYLDGDRAAGAELRRRSIEAKRSQTVVERETGESKSARIAKRSARRSRNRSSRRGSKQRLRYLSDAQIDWSNS